MVTFPLKIQPVTWEENPLADFDLALEALSKIKLTVEERDKILNDIDSRNNREPIPADKR